MIAPDMATMLVYIFTDAKISQAALQSLVSAHNEVTFNSITVDSDTSTSDTVLAFATGAADHPVLKRMDDAGAYALMSSLPSKPFPGGTLLRWPLHVAGMLYYAMRDRL